MRDQPLIEPHLELDQLVLFFVENVFGVARVQANVIDVHVPRRREHLAHNIRLLTGDEGRANILR